MGLAKSQQSLKDWTSQKWMTSGTHANKKRGSSKEVKANGKKRYLPEAAWDALSSGEKAATNKAKAKGNSKGNQFVSQPKEIKEKTKSFRKFGGFTKNDKTKDMKNMMYKKGGKPSKKKVMKEAKKEGESFLVENKELSFGAPQMKMGGKKLYKKGGTDPEKGLFEKIKETQENLKNSKSSEGPREQENYRLILKEREKMKSAKEMYPIDRGIEKSVFFNSVEDAERANEVDNLMLKNARKFSPASKKKGGFKKYENGGLTPSTPAPKPTPQAEPAGKKKLIQSSENGTNDPMSQDKFMAKKGGAKTMEPGGGGRFAKMVKGLKKEGKSEESAKAIAASIGRKKYGKSKFQAMAAAGKKKMGGKKC